MDEILLIFFFILFAVLVMITIARIDKKNKLEKENVEDLRNMKDNNDTAERIIPDNVHADKPTTESTQDVDCKKYTVNTEELGDVEKVVIGNNEDEE